MIQHLEAFIAKFAGYGNSNASIWFVGMEEGGGKGIHELERRVLEWNARGQQTLEDLSNYHHAIGLNKNFVAPFPLQSTWSPLIKCLLAWRGQAITSRSMKKAQREEFGAQNGDSALVELLPLPSPGVRDWKYASLATQISSLESRAKYTTQTTSLRVELLHGLIDQAQPKAVVFYGRYPAAWASIARTRLIDFGVPNTGLLSGEQGVTRYAVMPHPQARGTNHASWEILGRRLRDSDWLGCHR